MLYSRIVNAYEKIDKTTKRTEITNALVDLLTDTDGDIIDKVVYLTQGKLYPDYYGIEIGIAEKLAIRCISRVSGKNEDQVQNLYKKYGDIGDTAEQLLNQRKQDRLGVHPLTVQHVYSEFDRIARMAGEGSVDAKVIHLTGLLANATPTESKYISRMAVGKLRLGMADMTILDALAESWGGG